MGMVISQVSICHQGTTGIGSGIRILGKGDVKGRYMGWEGETVAIPGQIVHNFLHCPGRFSDEMR